MPKQNPSATSGGGAPIRTNAGISGAGGRNVDPLYQPQSRGATKVANRVDELNSISDARTGGAFQYQYKKGKLTELVEGGSRNVKPRDLGKVTKQMAPSNKAAVKKYKETNTGAGPFKTPKVPAKKSGK